MISSFIKKALIILVIGMSSSLYSQTSGNLIFTFTEIAETPTYNGNAQHVLAVWVQNTSGTGTGTFVKTKLRYAGNGTNDHLPTWAVNSGGSANNCLSASCNVVDATTGATRSAWTTYTVNWDGKKGATDTGTLQPDGTYKLTIQSTWNHGPAGTAIESYTFTKGASEDHQAPPDNAYFKNVKLDWIPSSITSINENNPENPNVKLYPNPSSEIIYIDYSHIQHIQIFNTLGVLLHEEVIDPITEGMTSIHLDKFASGIYLIKISNHKGVTTHPLFVNK